MHITDSALYRKNVVYLIAGLSVFRFLISYFLELGNDESYYWLYHQQLFSNYFDHPPMVAIWTRIFSLNGSLPDREVWLRIGSIAGCALSTWFMFQAVSQLHSPRAGFFAAVLYNASFYAGLTAGIYLMPDAPQMVFWTLCMWLIVRITTDENNWKNWILFGICSGFCIMSKVHGIFQWGGLGLYMLLFKRSWFSKPQFYVAALLTIALTSPILVWNIKYEFATFRFHSERVTIKEASIEFSFIKELVGQVYFNNPVNFGLVAWGLAAMWLKRIVRTPALVIFNFVGLPLSGLLLFISLFRDTTLPHWSGPAFVSLLPLAAIQLAHLSPRVRFPNALRISLFVFVVVLIGWVTMAHFYPGTVGSKDKNYYGRGDISLDIFGWEKAGEQFALRYKDDVAKALVPPGTPLVCTYWWGAHVEYYFARPLKIPMIGLGPVNEIRHYRWMNQMRAGGRMPPVAYCVMPVDEQYLLPYGFYDNVEMVESIMIERGGKPAHEFRVYRLSGLSHDPAAVTDSLQITVE